MIEVRHGRTFLAESAPFPLSHPPGAVRIVGLRRLVHTAIVRSEAGDPPEGGRIWTAERAGINLYSEHSLHARLKELLAEPGDRLEALVDGKVVDLVKADGELVEVQTSSLAKIAPKALALAAAGRRVRVVHPIAAETSIRRLDPVTGELVSVRKSPKRGDLWSLFDELVRAPSLIAAHNVSIDVLLVRATVIRIRDGSGSWRRRGDRTEDRLLEEILSSRRLETRADWLGLIPRGLEAPWSSRALGEALGIPDWRARKLLYSLCRAGLLAESGKEGRRKLYMKAASRKSAGSSTRPRKPASELGSADGGASERSSTRRGRNASK